MPQIDHLYYTYIVASRSHTLYTGVTSGIEARMFKHKNETFEGFSKRYHCNRLVWFERFGYIQEAITREKQIKSWSKAKKIMLIERENPAWIDLSEDWGKPIAPFDLEAWEKKATAGPSTPLRAARDDKD